MRNLRYSLSALLVLVTSFVWAQEKPAEYYTSPAAFKMTDEITLYVDLTGTGLESRDDLHIWSWLNGDKNSKYNGEWGASADESKLTAVEDRNNTFSVTFTPSDWFGTEDVAGGGINFLIKAKNGDDGKTADVKDDDSVKPFDFSTMSKEKAVIVPAVFDADTEISLVINVRNAVKTGKKNIPDEGPVFLHAGVSLAGGPWTNGRDFDSGDDTQMTKVNDEGVWMISFVPSKYFKLKPEEAKILTGIYFVANNGSWGDYEFKDGDNDFLIKPYAEDKSASNIRFFPSAMTADDMVFIHFDRNQDVNGSMPLADTDEVFVKFFVNGEPYEMDGAQKAFKMNDGYNGRFVLAIIPSRTFEGIGAVEKVEYYFTNADETGETVVKKYDSNTESYINYMLNLVK
ncbi:hypothetical protein FUAX_22030 [Fulvitalea axinellae]|uniref:Uncharacterized protein n=1 Tax=Fulvitalea axinellae TaxID=1182444 RepID=A0AAU9CC71_9BACT|nr:hypothetical protein FUAX_22030 [Fulvitalea axinellae]